VLVFWWVLTELNLFPFTCFLWSIKRNASIIFLQQIQKSSIGNRSTPSYRFSGKLDTVMVRKIFPSWIHVGLWVLTPQTNTPYTGNSPWCYFASSGSATVQTPPLSVIFTLLPFHQSQSERVHVGNLNPTPKSFISAVKSEYQTGCFFHHITCRQSVVPDNKLS